MTIRQSRYILAETEREKKVRVTEVQRAEEDPFIRRSEVQQKVNNSTLPVSSRAVNLAIESINSDLDLKADKTELEGLATEDYVNEKIDEKEVGITEPELISKSVGLGKWMREGAYGIGGSRVFEVPEEPDLCQDGGMYYGAGVTVSGALFIDYKYSVTRAGFRISNIPYTDHFYLNGGSRKDDLTFRDKCLILHDKNTTTDKSGVLHSGRGTPINTLNVSDMSDTVVDNDLLTVTSGAVFRAIKQLTDQIISLEARVRELEDG